MDEVSVVFPGNSELARLCRAFPWEQSPLGSVSSWPASMKSVVSVLIQCTMPMIMYAGKDFVCIYNDAYAPSLGKKHPHAALGLSCRQVWKEIWPVIGPDMERALDSGVSKHFEDCLLFLERSSDTGGSAEESYHSFSLTPVGVESGSINSLLVSVVEVTDKVIAKRRLQFRNELSSRLSKAHCSNDIFSHVRCMCDPWLPDLPYALLYRVLDGNDTNVSVSLVAASGLPEDHPLVSSLFADGEEHMPVNTEGGVTMVDTIDLASHSWGGRPCNRAAIVPMISPVTQRPFGYLVCGVNPARPVDADYIDFFRLLSDSVATAMANVDALDAERQRAEELAKIDAAKTMFFSNISHEFRTPLSLIVASVTDALADDSLDSLCSSQRERMILVQRNAQRLLRLVNSLLDFSRIEAGRASAHFSPTDVRQVTAELTSCFESLFEKGGLQLSLESENVSEPVYLDLSMWEKIVTNLLSNAFKFTLEGSVTIRLRQKQEQNRESGVFLMEVEDTGVGIPSDEVQHLFERFHRVERSSGRTFEGSGIGLALVNELVKLHGGTISVRTEYGKGSCFTVCVPLGYAHLDPRQVGHERVSDMQLADRFLSPMSTVSSSVVEALQWTASPPHARKKDLDSNVSRQVVSRSRAGSTTESEAINTKLRHADGVCIRRKSYHVLLADDNADMRQYISKVLSCIAHVDTVNDGLAALQALQSDVGYDLVVSDVMMPQLSGFELISRMKETPSLASIPVILLSARAGHEATVEGLERGADDYIVKTSFSAQELIARVRNQLELQSLRYHLEEQIVDRTRDLQKLNASLQREIEDRKRAQKAVVDSEKRYRALAAVSPVGIGHAEPDGRVTYANPCLQELFCLTEDEFGQGVWVQQIHPADRSHFAAAWNAYCNESEVSQLFCYTFQVQNSHGAVNWLLLQAIPEVDEDTNMRSGFLFAVTDISAQKTAEQQRLEESARSEEVQRARAVEAEGNKKKLQDFIDTVCHEVRNPLSGTFLNLDLQEDIVDRLSQLANLHGNAPRMSMDEYAEAIDQMATDLRDCILSIRLCSEHQRNVFNQVIELSRIESGKVAVENSDFVVQDALSEVYSMHEALFRRKRLHSRCSMPPEPVIVHADLVRFKQVIINLVNNAVKYSPEGASIHIQMEPLSHNNEKPQLVFRVEDTGPGFTEDEKKQLFERFARASRSRGGSFSEENNSSGLGLAICKATTQLLGGSIDLESEFGRGSTFIVSFPWSYRIASSPFSSSPQEKQNNAADGSVQDQEQHTQKGVRILVADDNHIGRRALEKILSKRGHEIALAKDGLQAVQTYSEFRPSVVLMDIEMPHVDGLEATRRIRAYEAQHNLPRSKIFAVSGYAREETQREALAAGMDGYLPKPFKPQELEAVLQTRE